jgi:peptidoglycan/xylan/chitin deacetylase (PgdA/CDA1 family)
MKKHLLRLLYQFLNLTNGQPFKFLYSGKVQILMFHRIVKDFGTNRISNHGIELTEDYLEYLINFYLKKGFIPISINDVTSVINLKNKKRYVVFTFDDGYYDNYDKALPIFEKYNIPFAVYVSTDFICRKQFAWWYFIEDIISKNSTITYIENKSEKVANTESPEQKEHFFVQLRQIIQTDINSLNALIERYKPDIKVYHSLFLTEAQLKEFSNHPLVTIGSHTISHPSLSKINDEQSFYEISNSKIELEKIIEKKVDHFSYPFGTINDVSNRELENVKKSGYLTALTTSYGDVNKKSNLLKLPRIWTSNENIENELLKSIYGINEFSLRT